MWGRAPRPSSDAMRACPSHRSTVQRVPHPCRVLCDRVGILNLGSTQTRACTTHELPWCSNVPLGCYSAAICSTT